jgi:GDP-mannose 6-dehydrogenase
VNICVIGLGYVGCVSAACLAGEGHQVIGVDINPEKVKAIQSGKSPIVEPGLAEIIKSSVDNKYLQATTDIRQAITETDLSLICVGTPSKANGSLDLTSIDRVSFQIGAALKDIDRYYSVVVRSTVLPGTTENLVLSNLERASKKIAGAGFGIAFNPEFLREGTAIYDFKNPPRTVIGEYDLITADRLEELYAKIDAPLERVSLNVSEAVKYADNAFHALKIAFANEIGAFCKVFDIDSHSVMDLFVLDTKLNLSPYYLKPGAPFGGSCLPKDIRALLDVLKRNDVEAPVLEAILPSNDVQKKRALKLIMETGNKKIGFLGLSFKENTDDLRESPFVELIERLIGKGYEVRIFDPNIILGNLIGANRDAIRNTLPHLDKLLLKSKGEIIDFADTIVISSRNEIYSDIDKELRQHQKIVDLIKFISRPSEEIQERYYGIAW